MLYFKYIRALGDCKMFFYEMTHPLQVEPRSLTKGILGEINMYCKWPNLCSFHCRNFASYSFRYTSPALLILAWSVSNIEIHIGYIHNCSLKTCISSQGVNVSTKDFNFSLFGKYTRETHLSNWHWITWSQKPNLIPFPNPKYMYFRKEYYNSRDHCSFSLEITCESPVLQKFHISVWKHSMFPMLKAEWLHL